MLCEDINFYKNRPIPLESFSDKVFYSYKNRVISNANILSDEKLSDIQKSGIHGVNFYHSVCNPPYYQKIPSSIKELCCRKTVLSKLLLVNSYLKRYGLELYVFDAYRPIEVQNFFYFQWVPEYLRIKYKNKSGAWIKKETGKYWANGSKSISRIFASPPPHSTGAAIDLTIRFVETKQHLEMGSMFDDTSEKSHTNILEKREKEKMSFTEDEALKNRRLLFNIMAEVGFASHPKEWWHFSYGDQMWSVIKSGEAFYGYVDNT